MESEKFDELIKRVGTARVSRLTALRGLAGGALAALAGVTVASETAAGKGRKSSKKRKAKKKSRNSVAPTYGSAPGPKAPEKPIEEEPEKCPADSYENCGYDADWSDESCSCKCKNDNHDFCHAKDDSYYLYGTCVDTRCDEYQTYNPETCYCEDRCQQVYDCGDYGDWDYDTCACKCNDKDYEVCKASDNSYDLYGTCVDTRCDEYQTYNPETCYCEDVCYPKTCDDLKKDGIECGVHPDGCGGYTEDCGDCKKDYYDNGYCDESTGKCACKAYTTDDCSYLVDTYGDQCKVDSYGNPYGDIEAKDGCGSKVTCPCKVRRV